MQNLMQVKCQGTSVMAATDWKRAFDDPIPQLVEGHADPLFLAPDDVTGNVRVVFLKDKVEALGDVVGVSNFERCPRNGNVAD
jgi:hypothetical protein